MSMDEYVAGAIEACAKINDGDKLTSAAVDSMGREDWDAAQQYCEQAKSPSAQGVALFKKLRPPVKFAKLHAMYVRYLSEQCIAHDSVASAAQSHVPWLIWTAVSHLQTAREHAVQIDQEWQRLEADRGLNKGEWVRPKPTTPQSMTPLSPPTTDGLE